MATAGLDQLENLTESLQRHLGLQQAQTFTPEDIAADALGRLLETRGDVSRLQLLWERPEKAGPDLVDRWSDADHRPVLLALRRVLDASLVVQRRRDGVPKSFLPFVPEFVTADKVSTVYRDLGRSVVEGLWGRPGQEDLRARLRQHLNNLAWPTPTVVGPCALVPAEADCEGNGTRLILLRRSTPTPHSHPGSTRPSPKIGTPGFELRFRSPSTNR